jgi:hypothetical protein
MSTGVSFNYPGSWVTRYWRTISIISRASRLWSNIVVSRSEPVRSGFPTRTSVDGSPHRKGGLEYDFPIAQSEAST